MGMCDVWMCEEHEDHSGEAGCPVCLKQELERALSEVRCQCGDEDACRLFAEKEALRVEREALAEEARTALGAWRDGDSQRGLALMIRFCRRVAGKAS